MGSDISKTKLDAYLDGVLIDLHNIGKKNEGKVDVQSSIKYLSDPRIRSLIREGIDESKCEKIRAAIQILMKTAFVEIELLDSDGKIISSLNLWPCTKCLNRCYDPHKSEEEKIEKEESD